MSFNEFNIQHYKQICKTISESDFNIYTLRKYFEEKPRDNFIILRHDVDYNIDDALKIAEIELCFGIESTYYIRLNKKSTHKKLKRLHKMVAEIGLHYDALARTNFNLGRSLQIFKEQLDYLNTITDVKTISAHGSSTNSIKNSMLIDNLELSELGLYGDAILSVKFDNIAYYSDAGRTWNIAKNKINDFPGVVPQDYCYCNKSSELVKLISEHSVNTMYISSHPELWAESFFYDLNKELIYGVPRFLVKKIVKYCKCRNIR